MLGMEGWVCGLITLKEVGSGRRYEAWQSRLSRIGKAVSVYVSTCELVARLALHQMMIIAQVNRQLSSASVFLPHLPHPS
jgi:hypothetical protein